MSYVTFLWSGDGAEGVTGRNYCISKAAGVTVTTDRGVDITEVMRKRLSIGSETLENSVCL